MQVETQLINGYWLHRNHNMLGNCVGDSCKVTRCEFLYKITVLIEMIIVKSYLFLSALMLLNMLTHVKKIKK